MFGNGEFLNFLALVSFYYPGTALYVAILFLVAFPGVGGWGECVGGSWVELFLFRAFSGSMFWFDFLGFWRVSKKGHSSITG